MDIHLFIPVRSVSGQIPSADLPAIVKAGFKSLICNRPDGKGADLHGLAPERARAATALWDAMPRGCKWLAKPGMIG